MSWIYLYFPNLQLDRCHKDTKDLTPFAIIDDNLNEVVQLNHLAHLSGIRKKMGLASSITLSSELKVATYEYTKENKELHKIAESLYFVVSDIFLDPPTRNLSKYPSITQIIQKPARPMESHSKKVREL